MRRTENKYRYIYIYKLLSFQSEYTVERGVCMEEEGDWVGYRGGMHERGGAGGFAYALRKGGEWEILKIQVYRQ